MPSINFFKFNLQEVAPETSFKIDRAELLLDCDEKSTLSYLTNAALLQSTSLSNDLEYARLSSPS